MGYRLGVDVGGTFTDLLLFDTASGDFWRHKTPSTPHDSSEGILTGVGAICADAGIAPSEIDFFLHGTTVATNAVLEGKGAKVGLVTTEGYRHILQIARSYVPGGLAGWIVWPKPTPLAALENTVTVKGRMDAQGHEVRPLDEADVRAQLLHLKSRGVEAVTVSLINAYANGAHETRIGQLVAEIMPDLPMSLSHEVLPEMQEYERTLTTVANASVLIKTGLLYTIMITGSIWEKDVFGVWLFAEPFFWEDVVSFGVIALHSWYVVALVTGSLGTQALMTVALAAYATYVVNAIQFILKLRAARRAEAVFA